MKFTKLKKTLICLLALVVSLQTFSLFANAEGLFDVPKTITNPNKSWTIRFSTDMDSENILSNSIFLYDENNQPFPIKIEKGSSLKEWVVTPLKSYEDKKTYQLSISTNAKSTKGKCLKKPIQTYFVLNLDSSKHYTATAKVEVGLYPNWKQITVSSTKLPNAKKYRIEQLSKIANLGELVQVTTSSDVVKVYFYSSSEELLGTGTLSVKDTDSNINFSVEE